MVSSEYEGNGPEMTQDLKHAAMCGLCTPGLNMLTLWQHNKHPSYKLLQSVKFWGS